jgi:tight adherence protein C
MSALGAAAGAMLAGGGLLVAAGVRARRPLSPADRIAPYVATRTGSRPLRSGADATTLERILGPSLREGVERLQSMLGGSAALEARLVAAGRSPDEITAFRLSQLAWSVTAVLVAAGGLVLLVAGGRVGSPGAAAALLVLAAVAGAVLRDRALTQEVRRRREAIRVGLPSVADLLALAVGSGESPMAALDRVGRVARGPLAAECRRACDDTVSGVPFVDALDALARRVDVPAVRRFVDGVVIAVQRGTPLADVLRAQAGDARADLHRTLLETAGRKELQMLVPVVFLVLPTVVLVALYPAVTALGALSP